MLFLMLDQHLDTIALEELNRNDASKHYIASLKNDWIFHTRVFRTYIFMDLL